MEFTSGTVQGHVATASVVYPFLYTLDSTAITGSPQAFTQRAINDVIRIQGSGLGNAKSGLGLNIVYI